MGVRDLVGRKGRGDRKAERSARRSHKWRGAPVGPARTARAELVCSGKSRQVSDEQREEIQRAFAFKLSAGRQPAPTSTRQRALLAGKRGSRGNICHSVCDDRA